MLEPLEQWSYGGFIKLADPVREVTDLHGADVSNTLAVDLGRPGLRAQPGAFALRARSERDGTLNERTDVGLQASTSLLSIDFWILGMTPS